MVDDRPMSDEERILTHLELGRSLAIHGSLEAWEKNLAYLPFRFALEMHNEILPHEIHGRYDFTEDKMVPPSWYSEFCTYCEEHKEHNCALLIYGITKCEWDKQVILNCLLLERKLQPDYFPLPANAGVVLLVENKEDAKYEYHHLTAQVADRCGHIYLGNDGKRRHS